MKYIVELEPGTQWLAPWVGGRGRTGVKASEKLYNTERGARIALGMARMFSSFPDAKSIGRNEENAMTEISPSPATKTLDPAKSLTPGDLARTAVTLRSVG